MDAYRKVGRGGAGNFIQPKPADEASKDLEAQHFRTTTTTTTKTKTTE
jgi:hypothetical protein